MASPWRDRRPRFGAPALMLPEKNAAAAEELRIVALGQALGITATGQGGEMATFRV